MTSKTTIVSLTVSFALGCMETESVNYYRQSHDSQSFEERFRCKAVADAYVKDDPAAKIGFVVTLDKVDYSPARKSCVAELEATETGLRTMLSIYSVRDLLSGESLFRARCTTNCDALKLVWTDSAFEHVIKSASMPESPPEQSEFFSEPEPSSVTSHEKVRSLPDPKNKTNSVLHDPFWP